MVRFLPTLALVAATLLMTACGVKSAYNNADWLLMRWINDRVTLTDEQEQSVRAALEEHLAWHCSSELPAYARLLDSMEADVAARRVTTPVIENYGQRVSAFGKRLLDRITPTLIDLLASLNDDQVAQLMASFEERNLELLEESELSAEALRSKRAEDMARGMKRFTGRLTDIQRDRLLVWAGNLETTAQLALEHRLAWQARLAEALALRHDRSAFETAMTRLLQPGAMESEPLRQRRQTNRERTLETIVALHRQAPPRQTEHLRDRLTDLAADLEELQCMQPVRTGRSVATD